MNKRIEREQSSIMVSAVALLQAHGFVVSGGQLASSSWLNMRKRVGEGSRGNLTVTLRDHNRSEKYVAIEFNGLGVKKSKRMEYEEGSLNKIDSRIKRLVRTAQASADRDHRALEARLEKFTIINNKLCDRGFTGARQCDWTGRAVFVSNGYELTVSEELTSFVTLGGVRVEVDIELAIAMAVLAPTKFKEEDE